MHHFKIPIYQKQDIFVAKQHIFRKTSFKGLKWGFGKGISTQFLVLMCPKWEILTQLAHRFEGFTDLFLSDWLSALMQGS